MKFCILYKRIEISTCENMIYFNIAFSLNKKKKSLKCVGFKTKSHG